MSEQEVKVVDVCCGCGNDCQGELKEFEKLQTLVEIANIRKEEEEEANRIEFAEQQLLLRTVIQDPAEDVLVSGVFEKFFDWGSMSHWKNPNLFLVTSFSLTNIGIQDHSLIRMMFLAMASNRQEVRWCQVGFFIKKHDESAIGMVCEDCLMDSCLRVWSCEDDQAMIYEFHTHDFYYYRCQVCRKVFGRLQDRDHVFPLNSKNIISAFAVSNNFYDI